MSFYSDVQPGEPFRPSTSLSNDVRHLLNRMNGFGGGVNPAGNPGIVRIPVYNSTSAVLSEGKAVSIDISGIIAGECYPAIAFSDEMPCYGVLAKDLNPAEVGDCILSGLAVVQIATTPATGNYATPGTGGVFTRGDEGVPIVNISGTAAVVILGNYNGGSVYKEGYGIDLTGGTASVKLEQGSNITITDNPTTKAKIITANTGSVNFPDWAGARTTYFGFDSDMWITSDAWAYFRARVTKTAAMADVNRETCFYVGFSTPKQTYQESYSYTRTFQLTEYITRRYDETEESKLYAFFFPVKARCHFKVYHSGILSHHHEIVWLEGCLFHC